MISKKKDMVKLPPVLIQDGSKDKSNDPDELVLPPIPEPKPHHRVYHVGTMRFPVKEAPLRDSPRGRLVQKYKDILKKGRKPAAPIQDVDEHEPPRRPAGSGPPRPDLPIGFPRFRKDIPESYEDDDDED